ASSLHAAPVFALLEGVRRLINLHLAIAWPDKHHADRQALTQAAWYTHGRQAAIEGCGVADHLAGALDIEADSAIGRRDWLRLHRHGGHQKHIVALQRLRVSFIHPAHQILRLAVEPAPVLGLEMLAKEHADLERMAEFVGPVAPL